MTSFEGIKSMVLENIPAVVSIHLAAFPGFFLSFLGPHFLHELYSAILQDPSGISWVYQDGGQVLGFAAGTDCARGFYPRLFRKRWLRFAWAAGWAAIRRPSIIPRLLRAVRRDEEEDVHDDCATLMSIAVTPEAQGKGIGQELVKAFLDEAKARGISSVNLTTDRFDNETTNRFYQNLGFSLTHSYVTPEGRAMNEYRIGFSRR